jgi:c-di-GMP-binding flagellar brake protein YcgR
MEHRWDARIHAPVDVVVHAGAGISLRSHTRNISCGGILVELDDPGYVAGNSDIEKKVVRVEFNEEQFAETLPALVIRRKDKTAALMFVTRPRALRSFLHQLNW